MPPYPGGVSRHLPIAVLRAAMGAICLFAAARVFPHVTGVFLIVVGPPTVPAQLSAAAACYYGKNYSFCRVAG